MTLYCVYITMVGYCVNNENSGGKFSKTHQENSKFDRKLAKNRKRNAFRLSAASKQRENTAHF
jgi:hypothetical protein